LSKTIDPKDVICDIVKAHSQTSPYNNETDLILNPSTRKSRIPSPIYVIC